MKILIAHMWLVIGGAETHVVELSRALAAMGHDVTVASFGGVYVGELESSGVKHFTVPLHTRKLSDMYKSYRMLKKLIKQEKFDIVHAHSRIPAFICGRLAKKLGFRFITSTHAVFKVSPLLSLLSDWGDHTFAVSCDIKQYLIDNYGTPADNITLTVNGIDTDKFSSAISPARVEAELSLMKNSFRAVYVSRIDNETALPGFLLCEAAPELIKAIPELEIVIVGGGTAFDRLKACADKVNSAAGRNAVILTGPRTDVAEVCATADVFVGVSRAALEAMSLEKPVILAGQQGYIGVLTDEVMPLAKLTNFTCRGERMPDAETVKNDILAVYAMSAARRAELGRLGREEVLASYSVKRMAQDHIAVYERMVPVPSKKHGDVIISGYYGFNNIGDDSLLSSIIDGIRTRVPGASITVLAKKPRSLAKVTGVRCINRFNILSVALEMRRAKILVSGGGSLLQDGTSKKSLYYYIFIMRMAKKRGLKLMLYANGLGPLSSVGGRAAAAQIIEKADYVSLRERASLSLAREMGVGCDINVSADPSFLLRGTHELWKRHILGREGIDGSFFVVSLKDGNNFDREDTGSGTVKIIAEDIRAIAKKYSMMPVFVPMYREHDREITERLAAQVGIGKVISGISAGELYGIMEEAKFVIGTRLHMLVFAASAGIPMLGISYDPKIDAFLEYIGEPERALDIRCLKSGQIAARAEGLIGERADICARLAERASELRELARKDCDVLADMIKES